MKKVVLEFTTGDMTSRVFDSQSDAEKFLQHEFEGLDEIIREEAEDEESVCSNLDIDSGYYYIEDIDKGCYYTGEIHDVEGEFGVACYNEENKGFYIVWFDNESDMDKEFNEEKLNYFEEEGDDNESDYFGCDTNGYECAILKIKI